MRGIWQRRYWEHTIRVERDYAAHMDYVHFKPVNTATSPDLQAGNFLHSTGRHGRDYIH